MLKNNKEIQSEIIETLLLQADKIFVLALGRQSENIYMYL